jgi:hypothetical protein
MLAACQLMQVRWLPTRVQLPLTFNLWPQQHKRPGISPGLLFAANITTRAALPHPPWA